RTSWTHGCCKNPSGTAISNSSDGCAPCGSGCAAGRGGGAAEAAPTGRAPAGIAGGVFGNGGGIVSVAMGCALPGAGGKAANDDRATPSRVTFSPLSTPQSGQKFAG